MAEAPGPVRQPADLPADRRGGRLARGLGSRGSRRSAVRRGRDLGDHRAQWPARVRAGGPGGGGRRRPAADGRSDRGRPSRGARGAHPDDRGGAGGRAAAGGGRRGERRRSVGRGRLADGGRGVVDGRERGGAQGRGRADRACRAERSHQHGLQRHGRDARARGGGGHGHRNGDRDGQRRPPARSHRAAADAPSARGRAHRAHARAGSDRDHGHRRCSDPPDGRHRASLGSRRRTPHRRLARRRRGSRRTAGGAVGGACPRRAADGAPARDRQEARVGGDPGVGVGGVLGQDRHADQERDDHPEGRHAVGRGGRHRQRLPAGGRAAPRRPAARGSGAARGGPGRSWRWQPGQRCGAARGRRRVEHPGRSDRGGVPGRRGEGRGPVRGSPDAVRARGGDPVHLRAQAHDHARRPTPSTRATSMS